MFDRAFELLGNPYVLLAIAVALAALLSASAHRWQFLYIAAAFAVLVSITPPTLRDPSAYINLWGPLETLRVYNRYFAVAGGFAVVAAMHLSGLIAVGRFPPSAALLVITHMAILIKNLTSTDDQLYSLLIFSGFVIVVLLYWKLFASMHQSRQVISAYLVLLACTGLLFVLLNLFQFLVNRSATSVVGGRFHGITNNPQMFVISISPFLPLAFFVVSNFRSKWKRTAALLAGFLSVYWVYLTGSRLGILLFAVAVVAYYQLRGKELFSVAILVGAIYLALSLGEVAPEISTETRAFSTVDTRTEVWKTQLAEFIENPVFGKDHGGARVTFGESTWLGAASGLGLVGLLPMLWLGARTIWLAAFIWRSPGIFHSEREKSVVLAVVAVSLVGSFFEAFLFGVLTLPVIVFLSTVLMMEHLVYLSRFEGRGSVMRTAASRRDLPGRMSHLQ